MEWAIKYGFNIFERKTWFCISINLSHRDATTTSNLKLWALTSRKYTIKNIYTHCKKKLPKLRIWTENHTVSTILSDTFPSKTVCKLLVVATSWALPCCSPGRLAPGAPASALLLGRFGNSWLLFFDGKWLCDILWIWTMGWRNVSHFDRRGNASRRRRGNRKRRFSFFFSTVVLNFLRLGWSSRQSRQRRCQFYIDVCVILY